ncbi:hypothetical protein CVH13_00825, partial [Dehalococcoides mccartyi]
RLIPGQNIFSDMHNVRFAILIRDFVSQGFSHTLQGGEQMTHTPFINISNRRIHGIRAVFLLLALFALTPLLSAGGHPVTKLSTKFHSIVSTAKGDYISASITNGGLGSYYSYWIEVPEGLTRLEISIFDPDTGGAHDIQDGTGWNTKTSFLLYNPASDPQTGDLLDVGENPSYDGRDNHLNILYVHIKQPAGFYYFQTFVHQTGRVYGNFKHFP